MKDLCLLLKSLWAMWALLSCFDGLCCCPPSPLIPTVFLPFLPLGSQISRRRDLMETSNLDSLSSVWLWTSVPAPICFQRKTLLWQLDKALIYKYSRRPLEVISLMYLFVYCQSCLVLSLVSEHMFSPSSVLKLNMVTATSSELPLPQHILQAGQIIGWGFPGWVGVRASLSIPYRVTTQTKDTRT